MRYSIHHTTHIRYSEPVRESTMEVRKRPPTDEGQTLIAHELSVEPSAPLYRYLDVFGNEVDHFDSLLPHDSVSVVSRAIVDVEASSSLPEALGPEEWFTIDRLVGIEGLWWFLSPSVYTTSDRRLDEFAVEVNARRRGDPLTLVLELCGHIHAALDFAPATTSVDSTVDLVLAQRRGVSQDFAHLFVALARRAGIPARYVSGYLVPDCATGSSPRRCAETSTHAWAEVRLPGMGWLGLDPTLGSTIGDRHIRLAAGRDYGDVPPTRGAFKGRAESEIEVSVRIDAVSEAVLTG